jgi:hypothetical protein
MADLARAARSPSTTKVSRRDRGSAEARSFGRGHRPAIRPPLSLPSTVGAASKLPLAPPQPAGHGFGARLPDDLRHPFESFFDHDFSSVRIHADDAASASASSLRARAYTIGAHVVFARDAYKPLTPTGRKLLAHELAHVVQQSKTPLQVTRTPSVGALGDSAELEARQSARSFVAGGNSPPLTPSGTLIQRDVPPTTIEEVKTKLESAHERWFQSGKRKDVHDALVLLAKLNDPDLKQIVIDLDTTGRLLDELVQISDEDQVHFGQQLLRINLLRNTVLLFQHVTDPQQKKFPIAQQPTLTIWRLAADFESLTEFVDGMRLFSQNRGPAGALGILAHGDAAGVIELGKDVVSSQNFALHQHAFESLAPFLAPDADVYVYGCISGARAEGSALLKKISMALPGRRIIGFNVINIVDPNAPLVPQTPPGFAPRILTSEVATRIELARVTQKDPTAQFRTLKPASADNPHAKWAINGVIQKWPKLPDELRPRLTGEFETPDLDDDKAPAPAPEPRAPEPERKKHRRGR